MDQKPVIVREVWADNLGFEFALIEESLLLHPLISFDTEFPGTIFESNLHKHLLSAASPDYIYSLMKLNLDVLKIVQLGITLSDPDGNLPSFGTDSAYIWQFNFNDFDIQHDLSNKESIQMLEKQGIDFEKNKEKGIDSRVFRTRWIASPMVSHCNTWITFHGSYDIGLLIKILTGKNLPDRLDWFMKLVVFYFGFEVYDLKLMSYNRGLHGGLEKVGSKLGVYRMAGKSHEAGSDSLLTMQAFIRFMNVHHLPDFNLNALNFRGMLYGLCFKRQHDQHLLQRRQIEMMKFYGNGCCWSPHSSLQPQFV